MCERVCPVRATEKEWPRGQVWPEAGAREQRPRQRRVRLEGSEGLGITALENGADLME